MSSPVALIIPDDPAFVRRDVCGTSLLLRSICVFARSGARAYVVRTTACAEGTVPDLARALARRQSVPAPVWVDHVDAVPTGPGLYVLRAPAVIDVRLCAALRRAVEGNAQLARCRGGAPAGAPVWYADAGCARELLAALTSGTGVALEALKPQTVDVEVRDALCAPVSDAASVQGAEQQLLAGTSKPSDTFIARHFDRHISHWLTRRLMRADVTPNQVTVVSTLVGLSGAGLLLLGTYGPQVLGAGLVLLATIIDGVDGELARLKFLESELGRKLDFWLDNVVNASALFATGAGYGLATGSPAYVWASAFNLVAAAATAVPIYFLFFRPGATAGGSRLEAVLQLFAGRDYAYLVFALALVGRVHWFTWICLAGLSVFLVAALVLLAHRTLVGTR